MKTMRIICGLILAGFVFYTSCSNPQGESAKQPNIIFIITDDQAPHTLKAYGNDVCETPNLDRLAAEGMVLDAAHHMGSWSGAVCLPSRTMIQTSLNVWKTLDPNKGYKRMNPDTYVHEPEKSLAELSQDHPAYNSIPAVFNRAGYTTFRTCKIGNTYEPANGLYMGRSDASKREGNDENGSWWHGEQVMDFLRERESTGQKDPFMIFYGFTHPHDPRYGKSELLAKYGAENELTSTVPNPAAPPLQVNYLPAHPFHHGHPGLRDEERVQGVLLKRDEATIRNELGREYACIENIDIQIGTVLDKLEEMGELDNTYILFTADHGIAVGRHGLAGKQNLYEHTWRVPFIVRGPGIKPGSRAPGNTYLMDVLPTICDLAGIEKPETIDGLSFKPVLMGEKETIRDVMYGVYCGGTKPGMRSVKKGEWKLIKYDVLDGEVRETQLFNLDENPDEFLIQHHDPAVFALTGAKPEAHQLNLADDPAYTEKRKEMEALLLEEMKKWGDPYRLWDQPVDSIK
ncbi:sulfatase-like hydrolase/transferase [Bacteroidota bacterium]